MSPRWSSLLDRNQQSEILGIRAEIHQLGEEVSQKHADHAKHASNLAALQKECASMEALYSSGAEKVKRWQSSNQELSDQILDIRNRELADSPIMSHSTKYVKSDWRNLLKQQERHLAAMLARMTQLEVQIDEGTGKLGMVRRDVASAKTLKSAVVKSNNVLKRTARNQESHEEETRALVEAVGLHIDALERECRGVLRDISELRDNGQHCERTAAQLHGNMETLNSHISDISETMDEEKARLATLDTEIKSLDSQMETRRPVIHDMKSEINLLRSKLEAGDVLQCRNELDLVDSSIEQYKREVVAIERTIAAQATQESGLRSLVSGMAVTVAGMTDRIGALRVIEHAQQQEKARLGSELKAVEAETVRLRVQVSELANRNTLNDSQVRSNTSATERLEEECRSTKKIVLLNSQVLVSRRSENRALDLKIRRALSDVSALQSSLADAQSLKDALASVLKQTRTEHSIMAKLEMASSKPLNVHNWTKLVETDPTLFEQLVRLHARQRELISVQQLIVSSEDKILKQERLLLEMRKIRQFDFRDKLKDIIANYRNQKTELVSVNTRLGTLRERQSQLQQELTETQREIDFLVGVWLQERRMEWDTDRRGSPVLLSTT